MKCVWWMWPSWSRRQIVALKIEGSNPFIHPISFLCSGANIGMSPSGKAPDFDSGIRRFESCHPSQKSRLSAAFPCCVGCCNPKAVYKIR